MQRTSKWLLILIGLLFCGGQAQAQLNVDLPPTTEKRRFNVNLLYLSNQLSGYEMQAAPILMTTYGLRDNVELMLQFGGVSVRNSGTPRTNGFGDTQAYIKWRFQEETKRRPQMALGYQAKFPTASRSQGLGTGAMDHLLWLSFGKSYGKLFAGGNIGYNFLGGGDGMNNFLWGTALTYQLTEQLILVGELYGNTQPVSNAQGEVAWTAGLQYNFAPNRSFFVHLGRSELGNSDLNVITGFSWVLGK